MLSCCMLAHEHHSPTKCTLQRHEEQPSMFADTIFDTQNDFTARPKKIDMTEEYIVSSEDLEKSKSIKHI